MLENALCPFKMYRHDASQVSKKKRDLAIFWRDRQYIVLLDYQAKSGMVGRYATGGSVLLESCALTALCSRIKKVWNIGMP